MNIHDLSSQRMAQASPLKKAIDAFLEANRLKAKFNETYLVSAWGEIMGKTIASRTKEVFVIKGKMYVKLTSAPLRNELLLSREKVINLLNQHAGSKVIDDVIFL